MIAEIFHVLALFLLLARVSEYVSLESTFFESAESTLWAHWASKATVMFVNP